VALFEEMGKLQQDLWKVSVPETVACPANTIGADTSSPAKILLNLKPIRKFKRPYTTRLEHTWRTRVDPLEGTTGFARLMFDLEPDITAVRMLQKLHEKYPDKITGKELSTVRRRLSGWRRESMIANLPEYSSDTRYDALAFSDSLQNLSKKALNLQSV
jgi:hypothetical protein